MEEELAKCQETIKQQKLKIEELERRYEEVIDKTSNDYLALEGSTSKIEELIRDKEEELRRVKLQN